MQSPDNLLILPPNTIDSSSIRKIQHVRIKRLNPTAKVPTYGTGEAACFDLHAVNAGTVRAGLGFEFSTGLSFEVPRDHVMLIFSRSGHGFNKSIRLANCTGVIDSDYRGEIMVKLKSDNEYADGFVVNAGDRIAQAMIIPVLQCAFEVVPELSSTTRGDGGFGSTGA